MTISRTGLLGLAAMTLALAGCQSSRFETLDTRPEPLAPAPTTAVQSSQLPPPSQPAAPQPTQPGQFPEAPKTEEPVQTAAATPAAQPAGGGADISKSSVVGSWKTQAAGSSCQMFLTLTKYGNVSRGGTRGCSGQMADMRGWDVNGKQLVIYNESGDAIARLYASNATRLDGQTSSGQAVTITR